ncbi:ABC transporter ATP-binding protein [Vagococcus bubulae]|uniref:ABC transporter domain-containing protein n=1 Tax=Vagococcus bubulae TaxID=1977868 RepID=A0A429ZHE8_9ENTE|nr:ABC transporter ATP-binding protein [Vagococcus bubulae]RST93138.1 hypothetical protein CBF36_07955 [Vagococcus bubulae]
MLRLENISYSYNNQEILDNINYNFESGKIYSIVGESGIGKSTLLSVMSGLEYKQSGKIFLHDQEVTNFEIYRKKMSYVFQSYNLISYLNPIENINIALDIHRKKVTQETLLSSLERLNLHGTTLEEPCSTLSGGQQQRVAIARALALDTEIIIADEPTGNLDRQNSENVMSIFESLKKEDKCIIMVTHDNSLNKKADVVMTIQNKQLVELK